MSTDEEAGQGVGIQCQTMQQDVRWGDQQWRQEVKIAPASRPDPQSPIPGRAWAQLQELFWDLGESYSLEEGPLPPHPPHHTLPPSQQQQQQLQVPAQPAEKGREGGVGKPGRLGVGRAGREQGWFSDACNSRSGPVTCFSKVLGSALGRRGTG